MKGGESIFKLGNTKRFIQLWAWKPAIQNQISFTKKRCDVIIRGSLGTHTGLGEVEDEAGMGVIHLGVQYHATAFLGPASSDPLVDGFSELSHTSCVYLCSIVPIVQRQANKVSITSWPDLQRLCKPQSDLSPVIQYLIHKVNTVKR